jgi:uroporphyrinogen decarboxylase
MTKRELIKSVLEGRRPSYVPWNFKFTKEAGDLLRSHFGVEELEDVLGNHLLRLGNAIGFFEELGEDLFRDVFGVFWGRRVDKDMGKAGGYIFSPSHAVEGDTPLENILAFINEAKKQIEV